MDAREKKTSEAPGEVSPTRLKDERDMAVAMLEGANEECRILRADVVALERLAYLQNRKLNKYVAEEEEQDLNFELAAALSAVRERGLLKEGM